MWEKIKAWFHDSETIAWARLQMLGSAVMAALLNLDPSLFGQYVPSEYLPIYLFASGVLTEYLRKRRGM